MEFRSALASVVSTSMVVGCVFGLAFAAGSAAEQSAGRDATRQGRHRRCAGTVATTLRIKAANNRPYL
jgi:hypothetical protein